ncbi:threonylcarbamoyl-AMP synthase [bacterium]|jgi:L-threonylcarbamoyladenylate synthase|nr:threonylcarbamoyl-AMP synthase [bacterium]MBR6244872.1 threonylcarbamoyl-AMP synthase [bacterium]
MDIFSVEEAAFNANKGQIVAYPTETVYGLGTIIYEQDAILRIKQIKGIRPDKPLSVLISNNNRAKMLDELIDGFLPVAQRLAKFFWPGPMTIVHKCKSKLPDVITGGTGFVGIRCSPYPFINTFIDLVGHPIISTSANLTGKPPATNYSEIFSTFDGLIDGVLICDDSISIEHQAKPTNLPSTIVKVDHHNIEILREGAIKKEDILRKVL